MQHVNIPIFLPELACRHKCIFCNQNSISGTAEIPQPNEVEAIVNEHLASIKREALVEIAFFGGSFTGIDNELQKRYLEQAFTFVKSGKVSGIRLSTRPDYITDEILIQLKKYGVTAIELGAQSFDDVVLKRSARGHTAAQIVSASTLIKKYNFELGLQMMIGLPFDSLERALESAKKIVMAGANTTRIYPALVIANTPLEKLYKSGHYKPLSLDEAVEWTAQIIPIFEAGNVNILRVGLHPSDEFEAGKALLAGPYHASFKELVMSKMWRNRFESELLKEKGKLTISVAPEQINWAIGFGSSNKLWLKEQYGWIKIIASNELINNEFTFCYS